MKATGIRRLLYVTGATIGPHPSARSQFMRGLMNLFRRKRASVAQDRNDQEETVTRNGLDWTIVKPPRLTNGGLQGHYRTGMDLKVRAFSSISRADLANFLLDLLRRGI